MNISAKKTVALTKSNRNISNYGLIIPYSAPYIAYIAIGYLDSIIDIALIYTLRIFVVSGVIIFAWRWYRPLRGPKSPVGSTIVGLIIGFLSTAIWISFVSPFIEHDSVAWSNSAFLSRLLASSFVVPLFEEFLMRGYIFLLVLQWITAKKNGVKDPLDVALHESNIDSVKQIPWNFWAILISTIAFTSGHHTAEWPAAFVYGLIMAGLMCIRKDLLSCVVAHGTTNFFLGLYVYFSGNWQYW